MNDKTSPDVSAICALGRGKLFTAAVIILAVATVFKIIVNVSANVIMLVAIVPMIMETAVVVKLRIDFSKCENVLPSHKGLTVLFCTELAVTAALTSVLMIDGLIILSMSPEEYLSYNGLFEMSSVKDFIGSIVDNIYDFPSDYEFMKVLGVVILFVMALVLLYYLCVLLGIWRVRDTFKKGICETKIPVILGIVLVISTVALLPRLVTLISEPLSFINYALDIAVTGLFAACVFKYNKIAETIR